MAEIIPLLVVASHHHPSAPGDAPSTFMSSAVIASGAGMFISFLVGVALVLVGAKRHATGSAPGSL